MGVDHLREGESLHYCQMVSIPYSQAVVGRGGREDAGIVRVPLHLGYGIGGGGGGGGGGERRRRSGGGGKGGGRTRKKGKEGKEHF